MMSAIRLSLLTLLVCLFMFASMHAITDRAIAQTPGIVAGDEVEVTGAGDCLNARFEAGLNFAIAECMPDGTRARIQAQSPQTADGERWWLLAGHGWAVERFLRVSAPPEPDLVPSTAQPSLRGLIAYVGSDQNVWLVQPDGTGVRQLTTDGKIFGSGHARYETPVWSADGRYLAFNSAAPIASEPANSTRLDTKLFVYDTQTDTTSLIQSDRGRSDGVLAWSGSHDLWVRDSRDDFHGCIRSTFVEQHVDAIDVRTGARIHVLLPESDVFFIGRIGDPSPRRTHIEYEIGGYCEGSGPVCAYRYADGATRCMTEGGWSPAGWLSETELLLDDSPYSTPYSGLRPSIVFDVEAGATRPASEPESATVRDGTAAAHLRHDMPTEIFVRSRAVLHVPAQEQAHVTGRQMMGPSGVAFLYYLLLSPNAPRSTPGNGTEIWVAMTDGSQRTWPLGVDARDIAWQPVVAPSVGAYLRHVFSW